MQLRTTQYVTMLSLKVKERYRVSLCYSGCSRTHPVEHINLPASVSCVLEFKYYTIMILKRYLNKETPNNNSTYTQTLK